MADTQPAGEHTYRTYMHEAGNDVEQTRCTVGDARLSRYKIVLMLTKPALPMLKSNKRNAKERCYTMVSVIAECCHIKFRHVWCV